MVKDGRGKTAENCPDLRGKHSLSPGTSFSPILSAFPDPRSKRENWWQSAPYASPIRLPQPLWEYRPQQHQQVHLEKMLKEKIMLLETTSHQVVKVHGQPSMGHHQLQLLVHFSFPTTYSSTLGVFQIVKHVWSLWAWFQTECLLDHLDVQLKFARALFIFPDFDWGSPTHIQTWNLSRNLHDQIFGQKNFTHWKCVNQDYFHQQLTAKIHQYQ